MFYVKDNQHQNKDNNSIRSGIIEKVNVPGGGGGGALTAPFPYDLENC